MRGWLKVTQSFFLASLGFYLLVVMIDFSRLGNPTGLVWAAGLSLGAIGVSGGLFLVLWLTDLTQRKNNGSQL